MNKKETKKIALELQKLGLTINLAEDSNILHFATIPYKGKKEARNKNGDLLQFTDHFFCWFNAEINKNGVGDDKKPEIALTYSIGIANNGKKRLYRHKEFYDAELLKFYGYSRTLPELIERLKSHLLLNNII